MALPLPQGKNFIITHRKLSGDFEMPSMEVASDHYSIGFIIHGDRKVITPTMSYVLHQGYVNTMAPFLYHRTIPASKDYYESYLIKFSPDMALDFTNVFGAKMLENIFKHPPKHFSPEDEKKIFELAQILLETYDAQEAAGLPEDPKVLFKYKNLLYTILNFISDRGIVDTIDLGAAASGQEPGDIGATAATDIDDFSLLGYLQGIHRPCGQGGV